jgi:hypothetical protein
VGLIASSRFSRLGWRAASLVPSQTGTLSVRGVFVSHSALRVIAVWEHETRWRNYVSYANLAVHLFFLWFRPRAAEEGCCDAKARCSEGVLDTPLIIGEQAAFRLTRGADRGP